MRALSTLAGDNAGPIAKSAEDLTTPMLDFAGIMPVRLGYSAVLLGMVCVLLLDLEPEPVKGSEALRLWKPGRAQMKDPGRQGLGGWLSPAANAIIVRLQGQTNVNLPAQHLLIVSVWSHSVILWCVCVSSSICVKLTTEAPTEWEQHGHSGIMDIREISIQYAHMVTWATQA